MIEIQKIAAVPHVQLLPDMDLASPYPKVFFITLNAARAHLFLTRSGGNRPENRVRINELADSMVQGTFYPDASSLSFNRNGVLLDGHHRLKALLKADTMKQGIEIDILVLIGLREEVAEVLDTGKSRSFFEQTRMRDDRDHERSRLFISAMQLMWKFQNRTYAGQARGSVLFTLERKYALVLEEAEARVKRFSDADLQIPNLVFLYAAINAFGTDLAREKIRTFYDLIQGFSKGGLSPEEGNPASACAKWLALKSIRKQSRFTSYDKSVFLVTAWNAFYDDETRMNLPKLTRNQGTRVQRVKPAALRGLELPQESWAETEISYKPLDQVEPQEILTAA